MAAWRAGRLTPTDVTAIGTAAGATDLPANGDGMAVLRHVIAAVEALSTVDRAKLLAPYADRLDDGIRHMVTPQELGLLAQSGVAIGMHGKTHTPFTRADDLSAELIESRRVVAGHMGVAPDQFVTVSFPHGKWTQEIVDRARRDGYKLMFTSVPAGNAISPSCPDVLARIGIETDNAQDRTGRFRPDLLALRLFRRPITRLP